ncbi:hypothetical protein LXA43DRAFT_901926 [Ganoderma leucocontextum]|nr:hypothetical protein LXA43DRAFT_901926 [Ganoderma leucocontextum]
MEDQELDLEITQEPLGSDPWKADEETGELPGDEPLLSQVNWENKLYQNLIKLYSDKAGRNIKPHRPQLELIEPFEADQVDWTRIATPQITESEETFLLRNVLLKINGDYREGHAVLHVTYFPHESERVQVMNAVEHESPHSDKSLDLGENNAVEQFHAQFRPYCPTLQDFEQSMMEMGFEYTRRKADHSSPDANKSSDGTMLAGY